MAEEVTTEDRGTVRILTINRPDQRNCVDGESAVGIGHTIEAFAAAGARDASPRPRGTAELRT
jgi:enoyl-CoA hydratase/carnithine racemase